MMKHNSIQTLARICGTLLIVAGITAFYFFIFNQANSTTVAMTFLLATLGVATWWGLLEAIEPSLSGMLCFNFFFLPPLFAFSLADLRNWFALGAFALTPPFHSPPLTNTR